MGRLRTDTDRCFEWPVGDWGFTPDDGYIYLCLPTKDPDQSLVLLPLKVNPDDRGGKHPVWRWDGNREAPTLEPSIMHYSTPPWHGYLRAGKLVEA